MPPSIEQIRAQYPQYNDISDQDLADRLHARFYSDLPKEDFYNRLGYASVPTESEPERATKILNGTAGAFTQGVTAGAGDEITGGLNAARDKLAGLIRSPFTGESVPALGDLYDKELAQSRGNEASFTAEHPVADIAAKLAGSVEGAALLNKAMPGPSAQALKELGPVGRILRGSTIGGLWGMGSGFNSGEGGLENRLHNAGEGGLSGEEFGAALSAVPEVLNGGVSGYNKLFNGPEQIARRLGAYNTEVTPGRRDAAPEVIAQLLSNPEFRTNVAGAVTRKGAGESVRSMLSNAGTDVRSFLADNGTIPVMTKDIEGAAYENGEKPFQILQDIATDPDRAASKSRLANKVLNEYPSQLNNPSGGLSLNRVVPLRGDLDELGYDSDAASRDLYKKAADALRIGAYDAVNAHDPELGAQYKDTNDLFSNLKALEPITTRKEAAGRGKLIFDDLRNSPLRVAKLFGEGALIAHNPALAVPLALTELATSNPARALMFKAGENMPGAFGLGGKASGVLGNVLGQQDNSEEQPTEAKPFNLPSEQPSAAPKAADAAPKVDPSEKLLDAVRMVESKGDPTAVSNKGAQGSFQIEPKTAKTLMERYAPGEKYDPTDEGLQRRLAKSLIFKELLPRFGSLTAAMAAYNSTPDHVARAIKLAGSNDFEKFKEHLNPETQKYIPRLRKLVELEG